MRPLPLLALLPILLVACGGESKPADSTSRPAAKSSSSMKMTASGLQYEVLREGTPGTEPKPGDSVTVHYTGWLKDGFKFDSSVDKGAPFEFRLGVRAVIEGWDEGVALMTKGSKYRFLIPWKLAYGEAGRGRIPPRADLTFEVELLGVTKGEPLPVFTRGNPAKQTKTASGLVYETLGEGSGDPPRADQGVALEFAFWTTEGKLVFSSATAGDKLAGAIGTLALGPEPLKFLQEMPLLMKPGATVRCEVPAALAWGDLAISPDLPPGSTTIWELKLLKVNDIPPFALSDPDVMTKTDSGLGIEMIKEGDGKSPKKTDSVTVHYTGWLSDGKIFDSSHGRGEPITFSLQRVIEGWREGLQLMKEGGIARLTIPPAIGYGTQPKSLIPPNSTLVFYVELIKIG